MQPVVKNSVAVFYPQGFLDGENATNIIRTADIAYLVNLDKKCKVVLVSLQKVIFFNRRGISYLLESMKSIAEQLGSTIGFCDYDDKKYQTIMEMYSNLVPFAMFDTARVGELFAGHGKENAKILLYNSSIDQRNKILMELYELGFNPEISHSHDDFKNRCEDFDYALDKTIISSMENSIRVQIKNNVIIYLLKDFLDSNLEDDFDKKYHENTIKIGFKDFLFEANLVPSFNIHAISFICSLAKKGQKLGVNIAICGLSKKNITSALIKDLKLAGVGTYANIDDYFSDHANKKPNTCTIVKEYHLTKKLVSFLPIITQNVVNIIQSITHSHVEKKHIVLSYLKLPECKLLSVAIAFYGSIEAMITFSMEVDIAKKACNVLLPANPTEQDIHEALGELINIIGEKLVSEFRKKDINIAVTMPRLYKDREELYEHKGQTKGALIELHLEGQPIILFITR